MQHLSGISAAPGVVVAPALIYDPGVIHPPRYAISTKDQAAEEQRFRKALAQSEKQITELADGLERQEGMQDLRSVFEAHIAILHDPMLVDGTLEVIRKRKINAEYAVTLVMRDFTQRFKNITDEILSARLADFTDIAKRVVRNLMGYEHHSLAEIDREVVIIARDLSPSDTVQIPRGKILGIATDVGGRTSHTAIIARAFEIPAVVALQRVTVVANEGDLVAIDGDAGLVVVRPSRTIVKEYEQRRQTLAMHGLEMATLRDLPGTTLDGFQLYLEANIEIPEETEAARRYGADGIGLYRTEFLYLSRNTLPTEEDHYQAYREVAEAMAPQPVTIRTLDLGGDKFASPLMVANEMNPFLGWRAIRMCLERTDIFMAQLRAILRASTVGNLRMMYPMVSSVDEVLRANEILEQAKSELDREGVPYDKEMDVGVMIEIPSAALQADALAELADFFSIGTNDLIQYTLAVDRVNPKLGHLYDPLHPAVLRLINETIQAGHRHNIDVGMCGEMAGDPELCLMLMGMGMDSLSMSPSAIPKIKQAIRASLMDKAVPLARAALEKPNSEAVREMLADSISSE